LGIAACARERAALLLRCDVPAFMSAELQVFDEREQIGVAETSGRGHREPGLCGEGVCVCCLLRWRAFSRRCLSRTAGPTPRDRDPLLTSVNVLEPRSGQRARTVPDRSSIRPWRSFIARWIPALGLSCSSPHSSEECSPKTPCITSKPEERAQYSPWDRGSTCAVKAVWTRLAVRKIRRRLVTGQGPSVTPCLFARLVSDSLAR
jgi:hypothetical protein